MTRLPLVASELATEIVGLDPSLAASEWQDVSPRFLAAESRKRPWQTTRRSRSPTCTGCCSTPTIRSRSQLRRKRRDNARSVREALTREVFINLNEGYLALEALRRDPPGDPVTAQREVSRPTAS